MTMNTRCVCFDETLDDLTASGIMRTETAGENLVFGDTCYREVDGKWWKADADIDATLTGELLMAIATILADAEGTFLKMGRVRNDAWDWTVGGELWVSTTPGIPTQIKPDNARLVGQAEHADYLYFCSNGLIEREFAHQEIHEHFLQNLLDMIAMEGGTYLLGKACVGVYSISKATASILKLTTGGATGSAVEMFGLFSFNPNDYAYLIYEWYWKLDSVNVQSEMIGLIDSEIAETASCLVHKGTSGGTVKFVTTADGISYTTTDNITQDITAFAEYAIKIKSGHVYFFLDEVEKAHHTTNIPFDVTEGLILTNYLESSEDVARDFSIDYYNFLLGRSF